jgi:hypothetical protein
MRRPGLALAPVLVLISLAPATTVLALPPGAAQRGFRDGANHHLGDDSFVAEVGRAPTSADSEALRMRTHLRYVRDRLAQRPPTRPELAARRAELLGYLDDYIAHGIAPRNDALPWRSPVFIDDGGNICAVGYLIERSVGRALAERIARAHRYDFLEDIAAALPEVRAWVESSGHYDPAGKLLARSTTVSTHSGENQYLLHILPGSDGAVHEIDLIGGVAVSRLDAYVSGSERLYVFKDELDDIHDADGNLLTSYDHTWFTAPCHWSAKRRRIAHATDVSSLHELLFGFRHNDEAECGAWAAMSPARSRRIDRMLAQQYVVRSVTPEFVRRLALGQALVGADPGAGAVADEIGPEDASAVADLPEVLAANMVWYVEWPHIDRRFLRLFRTIPGYWLGRPNGQDTPESEREKLEGIAAAPDAAAAPPL